MRSSGQRNPTRDAFPLFFLLYKRLHSEILKVETFDLKIIWVYFSA